MISEDDRNRARHHLGYGMVQLSSTFLLGVPAGVQTAFMIEGTWARILPSAEKKFVHLLDKLDELEWIIFEDAANTAASKVGEIELNADQFEHWMKRYLFFQGAVANLLQVPANPFDQRFAGYGGGQGMNATVHHG